MLNKVILMGRLCADPELRHTQSNTPVASFRLAVDGYIDKNGNKQTDFINCVAWGKQAEFVSKWFTKGKMAILCGHIQTRTYQDKNGNKQYVTEVVASEIKFGETKKAQEANGSTASQTDDWQELDDDGDVPF